MWQMIAFSAFVVSVSGHGRVLDPPGRGSMWRMGYPTSPNYDDDGVNCGGFHRHYSINNGNCGVCGDAYDMASPRTHELGGVYGLGIIVEEYEAGQIMEATIQISAYHKGYWYFKICTDPSVESNQDCFDKHTLELEDGGYHYYPEKEGTFTVRYRIPYDISCEHCVLQWRYVAGNNWGVCDDGRGALGCGNQETFGACSDIKITSTKYLSAESIPLPISAIAGMEGLLRLLRKENVAPYRTKPKRKHNNRKNHRQPRTKERTKEKKRKKVFDDPWYSWP